MPNLPSSSARITPYELAFSGEELEERLFPRVAEDAKRLGLDALSAAEFRFVPAAAEAVRETVPADAPAEAMDEYAAMLYHAFNYWRFGKRLYLIEPAVARYLVEAAPALEGWELDVSWPAAYLQLPANLFWASISSEGTPEPVDGIFITIADMEDAGARSIRALEALMILGVRRDRAGFSAIPVSTEAGAGSPMGWVGEAGREEGADFESVLPGGDLSRLYSILTVAEVLKLVGRCLWYVDTHPEDVAAEEPDASRVGQPGEDPPSRQPFHRVSLRARGGES